jgi:hypothetical protein
MMKNNELIPFQRFWVDPDAKSLHYNKIMIVPVFVESQFDRTWMERNNIRTWLGDENDDIKDFAKYTEEAFKEAIKKSKTYQLATEPSPQTLILELALVKIVPGKPVLRGLGNISNLTPIGFILMPIKVSVGATTESPLQASVAVEGNIRDSMTKKIIASFADNEKQSAAIFNLNDFTAYGNLRQIVNEWARQFVECLDKKPLKTGIKIEGMAPVKTIDY